jgi:membrane-associated phospholipid phosphatase
VGLILFSVIYLGEHWVTDAIAGYVYAAVIWAAVTWACRASRAPSIPVATEVSDLGRLA